MVTSGQVLTFKDSQDGLFNADKAKTEFNKAKEALQAQGVQFPLTWTFQLTKLQNQL